MAEADSKDLINNEEKARIQTWWERIRTKIICPVCQTNKFTVYDRFVTPTVLSGEARNGLQLGGTIYPHFMISCENCGTTQFVNAMKTGVLSSPPPPQATEGDSK
jgi:hypothetical protein